MTQTSAKWKPWLFALLAALAGLVGESIIEYQQRERMGNHERRHVLSALSQIRAQLEGVINGNLLMVQGLAAVIAANPEIEQTEFARIAEGMITADSALRNIAGAPGLVISLMHPVAGNEAAIGLDYRTHPTQVATALRAVETRNTVVAGPLELVQGGQALIARQPVFLLAPAPDAERPLWGLVSAVIDIDKLYRLAGLEDFVGQRDLKLAIRGRDGQGAEGEPFFGDPAVFSEAPELMTISLPGGSWQLAATPGQGWGEHLHHGEVMATRLVGLIVSAILAVLTFALTRNTMTLRDTAARLTESQKLFEGFMDNLPAGAFVKDPGTRETLFENRWLREQLPDSGHGCGPDQEADVAELRQGPLLARRELHGADEQPIYCDTLRFLLADHGEHDLIGGIVMDVSERVRAQLLLEQNRTQLRALLDTLPDLVWMKDPDGVYLACNRRFEDFFGAAEADIVGKRDHDFVPHELAEFFRKHDLAAMEAGRATSNEETVTFASDGHEERLETIKAPVHDARGELVGVLGIARDITARRAIEDALRANTERLQAAEAIAHIGNWEYRVSDGVLSWSDETFRLMGLEPGEREPEHDWLLSQIHPDDRASYDEFLRAILNAKPDETFPEQHFRLQRDDGQALVTSVQVSVDFGPDNRPLRLFGTMQDITERENLTHDLRDRVNELTRWQSVILGREDRILELKQEINELLHSQDRPPRYTLSGGET